MKLHWSWHSTGTWNTGSLPVRHPHLMTDVYEQLSTPNCYLVYCFVFNPVLCLGLRKYCCWHLVLQEAQWYKSSASQNSQTCTQKNILLTGCCWNLSRSFISSCCDCGYQHLASSLRECSTFWFISDFPKCSEVKQEAEWGIYFFIFLL